jgi:outer membrane protein assembly factor BamB
LGSSLYSATVLADGRIYQGCYDRNVYALEAGSGKILWHTELDEWPQGTPALVGDMLYVASRSGVLYGLRAADGHIVWRMPLGAELRHSPSIGRNNIGVVALLDGRLIGIDLAQRKIVWEQQLGAGVFSGPAIFNGSVLVVTQDGRVSAWK